MGNYGEIGAGGLLVQAGDVILDGNTIAANSTGGDDGGLSLGTPKALVCNNVIADNQALRAGGGLVIHKYGADPSSIDLVHNTVARNLAADGTGILVMEPGHQVNVTNTILVSHTVGISVSAGRLGTSNRTQREFRP